MTLQQLLDQLGSIRFRLETLERIQNRQAPPGPPPVTDNAVENAFHAAAEEETKSQLVKDLEAENAALKQRMGYLDNSISEMVMINNAVATTLKMPADRTAKDLPAWAVEVMARIPN